MNTFNKFARLHLSRAILHRERLVKELSVAINHTVDDESHGLSHYKFVLLYAPAGYGKTTVIADFARQTPLPCCWYMLDASDNERIIFLQRLITCLRVSFPHFGSILENMLANVNTADIHSQVSEHHFEALVDALIQAINSEIQQPFVLILSNFHIVNANPGISQIVMHLMRSLPAHCTIVIESRAVPNLNCEHFLLQQELLVIGANKLQFTAQEIYDLARLQGIHQLETTHAEKLATYFEGWIAGILLGTRLSDIQFLSSNTGQWNFLEKSALHKNLFHYVFNEVFQHEPDMYTFLQKASILTKMTPHFCNELLDITDAEQRLAYLEREGLFVTSDKDEHNLAYTCHPAIRELLCEDLRKHDVQSFNELQLHAATLYQKQGEYMSAIFHALEAQEYNMAACILSAIPRNTSVLSYPETIAHYIDALPSNLIGLHPQILLVRANIHMLEGQTDTALSLLEKAHKQHQPLTQENDSAKTLSAEIFIAKSSALFRMGEYVQAQELCNRALYLLPPQERVLRALAYQRVGLCSSNLGDCTQGIVQLQQALQLWGHHTVNRQTAFLYGQLAKTYNMVGKYALAEHHRSRAIDYWDQLGDVEGKINNLIGLGVTYFHQGVYTEAEHTFTQALQLAQTHHLPRRVAYALINLGELYQEQYNYKDALINTENGLALARQQQDSYLTNYAVCSLALIYFLMEDPQTALLLLSEVDLKTDQVMSYEGCFHELVHGTVFLYEQRYEEALTSLSALENITRQAGWKRRQLQVSVRLAACQMALGQNTFALQTIEKAVSLARAEKYEHLIQFELNHHKSLSQLIQINQLQNEKKEQQSIWNIQVNQPYLRIMALGIPTVTIDNKPITRWRMTRSIELFFLLLDSDHPVHKEQIITALWPDTDEQIDQTFRSMVHYLRKAIGDVCVIQHAGTYELNLQFLYGDHAWYDVKNFKELYACAQNSISIEDDKAAQNAFQQMVALYHGNYLQTFYSDWCRSRRDELLRMYMEALTHLAQITWKSEHIEEAFHYWQKTLEIETLHEEAHYGIMRYYLRQGKRTQALRQYQQYKEILHDELATEPGPTIQKLYQKIT